MRSRAGALGHESRRVPRLVVMLVAAAVAAAASVVVASPAHAVALTVTPDPSTVAPGDTVEVTVTPGCDAGTATIGFFPPGPGGTPFLGLGPIASGSGTSLVFPLTDPDGAVWPAGHVGSFVVLVTCEVGDAASGGHAPMTLEVPGTPPAPPQPPPPPGPTCPVAEEASIGAGTLLGAEALLVVGPLAVYLLWRRRRGPVAGSSARAGVRLRRISVTVTIAGGAIAVLAACTPLKPPLDGC